jgi:2-hydroxychromene-2-carboxylate isomerase
MTKAQWYFDFISPFSYLQLPKVREWRTRIDITPIPIAFGAVLQNNGALGPAEIPGRREFTYRFIQWQAEQAGIALRFPPAHPFNPLAALRLCIAAGSTWESIEMIFKHLWHDGRTCTEAAELVDVGRALGIDNVEIAISSADVKAKLRENTDAAIAAGVFGVPTLAVGNEIFWGNDASAMIEAWFANPTLFDTDEYRRLANLPYGVQRRRESSK